jgi:hypothetical protein
MSGVPDFLDGAIDMHVHSAPDVDRRRYNDIELVREAAKARMGGVLLKSHQNSTVERAWLVNQIVPGIRVLGGLVLNETVGGLNIQAVRLALALGAKQIWMPTRSARNHRLHHGQSGGIGVLGAGGDLVAEAREIVEVIAETSCVLGTGHLSPEETYALIRRASPLGVRVLVTHPEWGPTLYSCEQQKELARVPNVWFERCFVSTTHLCGHVPIERITEAIGATGIGSTILSTDLGQPDAPPPVEGLRLYAERLRAAGFSQDQVRQMMQTNPALLMGL